MVLFEIRLRQVSLKRLIGAVIGSILGIIGALIGTWLWGTLHLPMIANFWISAIVISTVGACILLFIIRLIKR